MGNDAPQTAPHNVYPCAGDDRWVSIVASNDREWHALARASGHSEWLDDPRVSSAAARWTHRQELDREIGAWTRTSTREEVTRLLQAAGVPAFPSYTAADIAADPHLEARGAIVTMSGPNGESRKVVGPPWRFSRTPAALDRWTPKLGEHNEYVFCDLLGLERAELEELVRDKVIY
jgi:crotonobetainyl-CoA:carnitine CoA-transferase CaiB-like acyl-CoA transferase